MKRLGFVLIALLIGIISHAQDFSYLQNIDLSDQSQKIEAKEAALECCCYLTGVRYDKKDEQRSFATKFISEWLSQVSEQTELVDESVAIYTSDSEEIVNMFLAYYAMNYIEGGEAEETHEIKAEALFGVLNYCSNSSNKLKATKELKQVEELYNNGELSEQLRSSTLTSSLE